MHPDPLISVITACYNGSAYLETSVRSALDNHPRSEVIIVDDGSTDDSLAHAAALAKQFPGRILAISQSNQGPAGARNTGIRAARGKYLGFLDVDDQYAPGFLEAAIDALERDPRAVGVSCRIELLDAHRPVADWQREAMENSGPCNLLMRTETVRLIGGFPTDPAFRGEAGGEDQCFRRALLQFGSVPKIDRPLFRYRMRPGKYVDLFLDRVSLIDGKIHVNYQTKEELDGSMQAAALRYQLEVTSRALGKLAETLNNSIQPLADFERLLPAIAAMPGRLSAIECHVLNWLARHWPIDGALIDLGSTDPRSLIALASAGRGIVNAAGVPAESADAITASLAQLKLRDVVTIHGGYIDQLGAAWQGRVRILKMSIQLDESNWSATLNAWFPHITRFGLVVLDGPVSYEGYMSFCSAIAHCDPIPFSAVYSQGNFTVLQKL